MASPFSEGKAPSAVDAAKLAQQDALPKLRLSDGSSAAFAVRPLRVSSFRKDAGSPCGGDHWRHSAAESSRSSLDVDLSWSVETAATASGSEERGILRVCVASALTPPCLTGQLRVRVCELESLLPDAGARSRAASRAPASPIATDAARALAARLEELECSELPLLPTLHPLWVSPGRNVGDRGKHYTEWNETAVLRVTESADLARARLGNLIQDVVEPPTPRSRTSGLNVVKVDFEWRPDAKPLKIPARVPMPRCREQMEQSAFFSSPHMVRTVPNRCPEYADDDWEVHEEGVRGSC